MPNHAQIKGSTLRTICMQAGISREDFLRAFEWGKKILETWAEIQPQGFRFEDEDLIFEEKIFMKETLYSIIFCVLIFGQAGCDKAVSNKSEPIKAVQTKMPEPKAQAETAEIKIDTEEIKTLYPSLKTQADEMGKAFLAKDFDKFTDFMYLKLIEAAGGREKFISTFNSSMQQIGSTGLEVISYEVGEPSQAIEIDNQVFAVLPTKTVMKISQRMATDEGSIIAVSDDKGSNWKFVRAKTKEAIRPLFPKVIDKLTFSESVLK